MTPPSRPLDLEPCWRQALAWLRGGRDVYLPVVGLFVFLPSALVSVLLPMEVVTEPSFEQMAAAVRAYVAPNLHWLVLSGLFGAYAAAVVIAALVHDDRPTLGEALARALPLAPAIYLQTMLANLLIGAGLTLFIVPGLYLVGRFALAPVLLVRERRYNPLWALAASWRATTGHGWRLALVIALIFLTGLAVGMAFGTVAGALGAAGGEASARTASLIVSTLVTSFAGLVVVLVRVAVWRQLSISGT